MYNLKVRNTHTLSSREQTFDQWKPNQLTWERPPSKQHAWKTYFKECVLVFAGLPPLYPAVSSVFFCFRFPLDFSLAFFFLAVASRCEFSSSFQRDGHGPRKWRGGCAFERDQTFPDLVKNEATQESYSPLCRYRGHDVRFKQLERSSQYILVVELYLCVPEENTDLC